MLSRRHSSRSAAALLCSCVLAAAVVVRAAPGDLDASFTANANDDTYAAVLQPGGKLIVGGNFSVIKGQSRRFLTRLLPDGTVDTQFNATATAIVYGITVQPDGKALIGGMSHPSFPGPIMYRVLTNGTLDPGFTTPVPDNDVRSLSLRNDGVITATGFFRNIGGVSRSYAVRLTSTGSLDATVLPLPNSRVACQAMLPDGKLLIGGGFSVVGGSQRFRIARLNANGTLDGGFNTSFFEGTPTVNCLAVQPDGKIVVGGTFASSTVSNRFYLSRFQSNGAVDTTFAPVLNDDVYSITLQCDGKMIVTGRFTTVNSVSRSRIARLNPDGTLDTGFNPNADNTVDGTTLQADGKIIVNGRFDHISGGTRNRIARLLNDPATESLTVPAPNRIQWLRGGSGPETLAVTFELSTNGGSSWTMLGAGTRIAGGWQRTGLALTGSGQIRARAVTIGGTNNGSQGILETIAPFVLMPEIAVHDGATTAAPELQDATSPPVDFGTTRQGTPVERAFTIANTGFAPLQVSRISAPAGFTLLTPPQFPVAVNPGQSFTFQVRLDATAAGVVLGPLGITSDDPDEAGFTISLLARVITPEITLREGAAPPLTEITDGQNAPVNFGMVRQTRPQTKVLTVSNTGTAPLLVSNVSVPPGFSLTDLPPLPATVGLAQALVFRLQLDAAAPGPVGGSVRVESDDVDEAVFDFPVSGTIVAPEITVHDGGPAAPEVTDGQAAPVDYGRQVQGTPGTRTFTVSNIGTAELLISAVTLPAGYAPVAFPAFPVTVGTGQALALQVSLVSLIPGVSRGSVVITSDDVEEADFDFSVTGTVYVPDPVPGTVPPAAVLNRQTGLREQTVRVTNDTTATVPAYYLIVRGLPPEVEVNNASSRREDGSWVIYVRRTMTPGSSQDVLLEYFSANRLPVELTAQLSTEVILAPPDLTAPDGEAPFRIDVVKPVPGGGMLIEFPTQPGTRYQVQYSTDGTHWQISQPSIRAAATRTQWIDRGLPRTDSAPDGHSSRFYRVASVAN